MILLIRLALAWILNAMALQTFRLARRVDSRQWARFQAQISYTEPIPQHKAPEGRIGALQARILAVLAPERVTPIPRPLSPKAPD